MRLMSTLFLFALAMTAGCGGCQSCFGTAQPGDDAATTAIAPSASAVSPLTKDAAAEASASGDAAADAASYDGSFLVATDGGVPRPKAPMPLGEFQTCGVYDGPLCQKDCKKGNCRQECDGVGCALTCAGGYCSQLCGATGKCKLSCAGGHCVQVCSSPQDCTKECTGGSCE